MSETNNNILPPGGPKKPALLETPVVSNNNHPQKSVVLDKLNSEDEVSVVNDILKTADVIRKKLSRLCLNVKNKNGKIPLLFHDSLLNRPKKKKHVLINFKHFNKHKKIEVATETACSKPIPDNSSNEKTSSDNIGRRELRSNSIKKRLAEGSIVRQIFTKKNEIKDGATEDDEFLKDKNEVRLQNGQIDELKNRIIFEEDEEVDDDDASQKKVTPKPPCRATTNSIVRQVFTKKNEIQDGGTKDDERLKDGGTNKNEVRLRNGQILELKNRIIFEEDEDDDDDLNATQEKIHPKSPFTVTANTNETNEKPSVARKKRRNRTRRPKKKKNQTKKTEDVVLPKDDAVLSDLLEIDRHHPNNIEPKDTLLDPLVEGDEDEDLARTKRRGKRRPMKNTEDVVLKDDAVLSDLLEIDHHHHPNNIEPKDTLLDHLVEGDKDDLNLTRKKRRGRRRPKKNTEDVVLKDDAVLSDLLQIDHHHHHPNNIEPIDTLLDHLVEGDKDEYDFFEMAIKDCLTDPLGNGDITDLIADGAHQNDVEDFPDLTDLFEDDFGPLDSLHEDSLQVKNDDDCLSVFDLLKNDSQTEPERNNGEIDGSTELRSIGNSHTIETEAEEGNFSENSIKFNNLRWPSGEEASQTSSQEKEKSALEESNPADTSVEPKSANTSQEPKNADVSQEATPADSSLESKPADSSLEPKPADSSREPKSADTSKDSKHVDTSGNAVILRELMSADSLQEPKSVTNLQKTKYADSSQELKLADSSQNPKSAYASQELKLADASLEPKPADASQEPKSADTSQEPKSADISKELKPADICQEPKPADVPKEPKPADNSKEPKSLITSQEPKSAEISKEPKSATTSQELKSAVDFRELKSATTSQEPKPTDASLEPKPADISKALKSADASQELTFADSSKEPKPADISKALKSADASLEPKLADVSKALKSADASLEPKAAESSLELNQMSADASEEPTSADSSRDPKPADISKTLKSADASLEPKLADISKALKSADASQELKAADASQEPSEDLSQEPEASVNTNVEKDSQNVSPISGRQKLILKIKLGQTEKETSVIESSLSPLESDYNGQLNTKDITVDSSSLDLPPLQRDNCIKRSSHRSILENRLNKKQSSSAVPSDGQEVPILKITKRGFLEDEGYTMRIKKRRRGVRSKKRILLEKEDEDINGKQRKLYLKTKDEDQAARKDLTERYVTMQAFDILSEPSSSGYNKPGISNNKSEFDLEDEDSADFDFHSFDENFNSKHDLAVRPGSCNSFGNGNESAYEEDVPLFEGNDFLDSPPECASPINDNETVVTKRRLLDRSNSSLSAGGGGAPTGTLSCRGGNLVRKSDVCDEAIVFKDWEHWKKVVESKKATWSWEYFHAQPKIGHFFKCLQGSCLFSTNEVGLFKIHLEFRHTREELRCLYCWSSFHRADSLVSHVVQSHGEREFQCGECMYRSVTRVHMIVHNRQFHSGRDIEVLDCPMNFRKSDRLQLPFPKMGILNRLICNIDYCTYASAKTHEFVDHNIRDHRNIDSYPCGYCHETCDSLNKLIVHLNRHNIYNFHCYFCSFGANESHLVLEHICVNHADLPIQIYSRLT